MTDRHEQARAEADRRVRDLENRNIYGPANSVGYLVGHAEGVEWADASPQPRTITRGGYEHAKRMFGVSPAETRHFLGALGIEVEPETKGHRATGGEAC